jgi:DNA-binding XRE family transcriptional regulator
MLLDNMSRFLFTLDFIMNESDEIAISELLRDKTGLTIKDYAKKLNVSRKTIYDAISGGGSSNIRVLIATALNTAPSKLWKNNDLKTQIIDDLLFARGL